MQKIISGILIEHDSTKRWIVTCVSDYFSLVTNGCYKLLENADVCKDRACRDSIFQLLGIMVKKHNHGLGTQCLSVFVVQVHFTS